MQISKTRAACATSNLCNLLSFVNGRLRQPSCQRYVDYSKKVRVVNNWTSQLDQRRVVPKFRANAEFFNGTDQWAVDFLCELGLRVSCKFQEEWQTAYLLIRGCQSQCSHLMQLFCTAAFHQVRTSGFDQYWLVFSRPSRVALMLQWCVCRLSVCDVMYCD